MPMNMQPYMYPTSSGAPPCRAYYSQNVATHRGCRGNVVGTTVTRYTAMDYGQQHLYSSSDSDSSDELARHAPSQTRSGAQQAGAPSHYQIARSPNRRPHIEGGPGDEEFTASVRNHVGFHSTPSPVPQQRRLSAPPRPTAPTPQNADSRPRQPPQILDPTHRDFMQSNSASRRENQPPLTAGPTRNVAHSSIDVGRT
ncbi:hypothetical protein BDV98DRAFT_659317, partial [Pterulicium gracile]